jgi:Ni/Co efflux regulator RcnB
MQIRGIFFAAAACIAGTIVLSLSPAAAKEKVSRGGQVQQVRPLQQARPAQPNFGQRPNGGRNMFQNPGGGFGNRRAFGNSGFGSSGGFGAKGFGSGRGFGSGSSAGFASGRGFGAGGSRNGFARSHGSFTYRGRSFRRFAAPRYRWPHGYGYRRYAVGGYLPRAFWSPDYYVTDYVSFGVEAPPPDFQWVRYGPDLLLIDEDTGEVSQTVYGVFDQSGDASQDDGSADPSSGDQ